MLKYGITWKYQGSVWAQFRTTFIRFTMCTIVL